jgi:hypothetical protein
MLYLSLTLVFSSYVMGFMFFRKYKKTISTLQEQLNNNKQIIDSAPLIFNAKIQEQLDALEISFNASYDSINHKLDNRSNAVYQHIDAKNVKVINDLKYILTNWENSEEFRMMLNGIRNREQKIDTGVNY